MKRIVFDIDDTITFTENGDYKNSQPNIPLIEKLRTYKEAGYEIILFTSRNMRTYNGNVGKITANTLPVIMAWCENYDVPYDEIYVGKPWCGTEGFYVDDKAIRPSEFVNLSLDDIKALTGIKS